MFANFSKTFTPKVDLSSFDESTEEGRLAKFEAICKELRDWFFYERVQPTIQIMFISKELAAKNPYLNCIRNTVKVKPTLPSREESGWNPETGSKVGLEEAILEMKSALVEFSVEAMKFKKKRTTSGMMFPLITDDLKATKYNAACEIVFWHLLASHYDDSHDQDFAKAEELPLQIGFTKPMLQDWRKAVDYVLEGNIFEVDCDLKFESEEAKIFFLHLYERADVWEYE